MAAVLTARDTQRLLGVHPRLIAKIRVIVDRMTLSGTPMFVVQGVRSQAEQALLYAKGRTAPGAIVTYIDGVTHRGPHQTHEDGFGYAVDLAFQPNETRADPFDPDWPWEAFGEEAENAGLRWGGRWHFKDLDHVELPAPLPGLVA